jgi:hypothetical protein
MAHYFSAKIGFTVEAFFLSEHDNQIILESEEAATRMQFSQVQGTV